MVHHVPERGSYIPPHRHIAISPSHNPSVDFVPRHIPAVLSLSQPRAGLVSHMFEV
jgi:hypothetical protein